MRPKVKNKIRKLAAVTRHKIDLAMISWVNY